MFCFFTETHEQLQAQFREMQLEHYQLKEEYDDLKEKMKFFTKVWKKTVEKLYMYMVLNCTYRLNKITINPF